MRATLKFSLTLLVLGILIAGLVQWPWYGALMLAGLILTLGVHDIVQKKHTILRNFPVIGHIRFLSELIGPEIHQYFVESNTDGKPIDRNHRNYIYERAKLQNETQPFGTQLNVEHSEHKWMKHSLYPAPRLQQAPGVLVGGPQCLQPYRASLFNISAMSYGALSKNAVMALNLGAKAGGFFHDTGEGGISEYHLQGGDLVYEVGTGYFGCRTKDGRFSPDEFQRKACLPAVKMIEIKLSQGAKPGHGGILPASKNSEEIARIRGVKPHTDVISPPGHSAFEGPEGLLQFIRQLRQLSGGKPVGFKLCIGCRKEFEDLCQTMVETEIYPDFITVDGSEGGTGAAPIDFANYVGMPWEQALVLVVDTLNGLDLKKHIRVFTATRIFTAFDIFRALCLGADVCSSARGMMLALGCIQALKCNTNQCPSGVTTNKPALVRGLVVEEKWQRVRNYHQETLKDFLDLFAAAGCQNLSDLNRSLIYRQTASGPVSYEQIYPSVSAGSRLVAVAEP
ncbi:FMN-binding glutamate synthase family protein [Oceanimonas smirnovii]|uniref:FMN-binding glutamate synthase family protein n=1 Tax=Oceanimonas smirnovii TaxID=264574 RepID=UPI003AAFCE89